MSEKAWKLCQIIELIEIVLESIHQAYCWFSVFSDVEDLSAQKETQRI